MGLPVWRSPSPAEPRDAQKPSRSPIRRQRNGRSTVNRDFAAAALARMNHATSTSTSNRFWDRVRIPERREEISHPPRVDGSQGPSGLPLPPVPELRTYTRSPVPMDTGPPGPPGPYSGSHSAFLGDSRNRLHEAAERVDRMRRRLNSLEQQRRAIERGGTGLNSDRTPPEPVWPQPVPMIRTRDEPSSHDTNVGDVLEYFDFGTYIDNGLSTSPRPVSAAVDDFQPPRFIARSLLADGPLPPPPRGFLESWSPPVGSYDGLGDRSRSFSPDSDRWETMLTSIPPDTHLPSADSSFTSAAASASFSASRSYSADSSSNSASSSRTSLTVPSDQEREREREQACDTDEDGPVDPLTAGIRQRNLDRRLRRARSIDMLRDRHSRHSADAATPPERQRIYVHGPLRSPRREGNGSERTATTSALNTRGTLRPSPSRSGTAGPSFHDRVRSLGPRSPRRAPHVANGRGQPWNAAGESSTTDRLVADGVLSASTRDFLHEREAERNARVAPASGSNSNSNNNSSDESEPRLAIHEPANAVTDLSRAANNTAVDSQPQPLDLATPANPDEDLDSLRSVVERLARRDDIPEEWWMSVGLTPVFAQRVRRERETMERL